LPFTGESSFWPKLPWSPARAALEAAAAAFGVSTFRTGSGQTRFHPLGAARFPWFLRAELAVGGLLQIFDLFRIKFAHLARLQIQHKRTIAYAPYLLHEVPDLFEHLAQLAIASFNQNYFIPGVVPLAHLPYLGRSSVHLSGSRPPAINCHTLAQTIQILLGGQSADFYQIGLFNSRCSPRQFVRQLAIIRHEQQAFAQVVQAADGVKPLAHLFEELHHCGASLRIAHSGDKPLRLVQHEVPQPLRPLEQFSVYPNVIACRISLCAQLGNYLAIHLHAALRNQFLRMATARDPGLCKNFLKSLELRRRG
jgi:hypothetical protein